MATDPSIIFQLKQPQIENPVNALANVLQLQQAQQGNQLRGMQMQEMQRGQAGENALAQLLAQDLSPQDVSRGLATQGYGKQSMDYTKQQQELLKSKAAAEKDLLANTHKKLEIGSQLLSGATDQATYDAARAQAQSMGIDFSKLPPQFDPAFVQRTVQQGIDMKTQLEQKWKAMEYTTPKAGDRLSAETSRANAALAAETARRGQNLVDARSREGIAAGKPPSGYRFKADGSLEPIPGGPAGKVASATEGERKAATLLKRLEGSQSQLNAALKENPDAAKPGLTATALRAAGAEALANTAAVGSERQRVEAAQLDMLDAALTLGTGAAYTNEQLQGYQKSYFPQIGDTPDTVRDKKARLENVIQAAKIAAGRAASQMTPSASDNKPTASNW